MAYTWRILLVLIAFSGIVGLAMWITQRDFSAKKSGIGYKKLSNTLVEEMVYQVGGERFPRLSCKSCKLGKVKMGPFSIGPLGVLTIEDLVVNLPSEHETIDGNQAGEEIAPPTAEISETDVVESLGLDPLVKLSGAKAYKGVARVVIEGLRVNRQEGDDLRLVFKARRLRTKRSKIYLDEVTVEIDGREREYPTAQLALKPSPRLVLSDGCVDLALSSLQSKRSK